MAYHAENCGQKAKYSDQERTWSNLKVTGVLRSKVDYELQVDSGIKFLLYSAAII